MYGVFFFHNRCTYQPPPSPFSDFQGPQKRMNTLLSNLNKRCGKIKRKFLAFRDLPKTFHIQYHTWTKVS